MTSSVPAVTVVTVTWNNLEGLRQTMASLAQQSQVDVQHVVVDGYSQDGSAEWAAAHLSFPQSVVISEPDDGIYDAMTKGLAVAEGRLITFLNAGDEYAHPDVLRNAVASHQRHGWRWGFGQARVFDAAGKPVRPVRIQRYSNLAHGLGLLSVNHQCVFMVTDLLRELGGFSAAYGPAADAHCLLRAGCATKPFVWGDIDVRYLAGGVSDLEVYRQLRRKHKVRVDVWQLSAPLSALSWTWTQSQIAQVALKKLLKRVATVLMGDRFTLWWGNRTTGSRPSARPVPPVQR